MLLVLWGAIASIISIGASWPPSKSTSRSRISPDATKVCVLRTSKTPHARQHTPYQGGWGENMSSINTRLLVFNHGRPGSYRSRQRRGVTSQEETRFYPTKHSRSQELGSAFPEQRSSLEHHTQDETSATC